MLRRVVIADDVDDFRILYRLALELDGRFEVVGEAGDGFEAAKLAAELQPDAVVLDLQMPRMDGFEAIERIKSVADAAVIVVVSSMAADAVEDRVIGLGARVFVEKGSPMEDFVQAVADAIG